MVSVQIHLLGSPQLLVDGAEHRIAIKQLALLTRLYAATDRRVPRGDLVRLLWARSGKGKGLHSLSQALYVIKRDLGPNALTTDVESISRGGAYCDVVEFRTALEGGDWLSAQELYIGPLARGLAIPGDVGFSHWLDRQRATLGELARGLARELYQAQEWGPLHRLTTILLGEEQGNREVLAAHLESVFYLRGPAPARQVLAELSDEFREEGFQILEDLSGKSDPQTRPHHPFVGRRGALDDLLTAFQRQTGGQSQLAVISGEPGVGKTALADRFCRILALRGARLLTATAYSAEQNVPLGVVHQWVQSLSSRDVNDLAGFPWMAVVRHVFPATEWDETAAAADIGDIGFQRLLESLRQLFLQLSTAKPLVLFVDDLHYTDSASLGFLHYLFRRQPAGPRLVVATTRTDRGHAVADLTEHGSSHLVHLRGLNPSEIEDWLARAGVSPTQTEDAAVALHRRTGGNPLLITTLIEEGQALSPSTAPPQSIVDFFRPRIWDRSHPAQRLLGALALAGEQVSLASLGGIAGLDMESCEQAARELAGARLVEGDSEHLALRHGLLGEVALSIISDVEKQALYGRAARALAAGEEISDSLIAISHDVAGNRADAFAAARKAAEACDTLHARAEKEFFLKLGLNNAPTTEEEANIRIQLGELYLVQAKPHEALDVLTPELFANLPTALQDKAELVRVKCEGEMAADIETLGTLWDRAEAIGDRLDPLELADMYTHLAGISHDLGFDSKSLEIAEDIAGQISNLPLTLESARRLLRPIGITALNRGFKQALERLETLPKPADGHPLYACSYHATRGSVLVASGRLLESESEFAQSIRVAEQFALFDHYYSIHNNLGVCLLEQGRFEEAEQHYKIASQFVERDKSPSHHLIVRDNLMIVQFERKNFEQSLEMAEESLVAGTVSGIRAAMSVHSIIGLSSLETGRLARSNEAEREVKILFQRHDPLGSDMSYVHIFLARMAARRGETSTAIKLLKNAAVKYRSRNRIAAARINLERYRIGLRGGENPREGLRNLARELHGSGAIPLIAQTEQLLARVHP